MHDPFIPLAQWLAAPLPVEPPVNERVEEQAPLPAQDERCDEHEVALGEVRRFRAALADALDSVVATLAEAIAIDVLMRELRLAPADVRAIAQRVAAEHRAEHIVAIRAHPDECASIDETQCAVVPDDRLRRGDVFLDVRSGTIDASLGARLDRVIGRVTAR
jgi:flagellar biosynthesis/type III secretory pathway protein FliH